MSKTKSTPATPPDTEPAMPLLDHLRELRQRLIVSLLALLVGTLISFPFAERVLQLLIAPLTQRPIALGPTDTIVQYFKVAMVGGVTIASPVILYQLIAFLVPALTDRERRYLFFFLPFGLLLFITGLIFSALIAVPTSLGFLQDFGSSFAETQYRLEEYISFVTTMLLALGIGFEMPLVIFFLARLGIVRHKTLVKNIRWAFLITAIVAAVLTPTPDALTMAVVMVPLFVLYLLGVFMARFA